jgi:5-enolpyruvylshikimate-3-phosphate synthase
VADLLVRHSVLKGIDVDPSRGPQHDRRIPGPVRRRRAGARARTVTTGLDELRVKEATASSVMARRADRSRRAGDETEDGLTIDGTGGDPLPGTVNTGRDHHPPRPPHRDGDGRGRPRQPRWRGGRRYPPDRDQFSGV